MLQAQALHTSHLDALRTHVSVNEQKLRAISPAADQDLFIECNIRPFTLPPDWGFEPCATHYDTGEMSVEPAPKVYLQNRLARCRGKLYELHPVMDAKRKEVEQFSKLADAYSADRNLGDVEEVSDNYLESQHQLTFYATSERILSTEAETITASLGGDEGGQRPHTFKSSAFSIPTTCAYCKSNIWGLSKQGKTCKSCGISVHSRCELKVPAECGVSRGSGRETATLGPVSSISRSSSTISKAPSRAPPTSALTKPTPSSFAHGVYTTEEAFSQARVVFSFTSTSPFELAVSEGAIVQVLEEDDGSGWVKVADNSGGRGLVPASYIELLSAVSTTPQNPVAIPASSRQQGSGQYVKGVFQYEAQGPDELSVNEGQLIELTGGLSGGSNYADGWWEGIDTSGKRGIFPSNYVKLVR
ncbi:hypothetical protein AcW1_007829 [Taiwanofungus camphoratus]|nr:hypothetical protein AcW2_007113 [Antrodia cinnamomea]KAI0923225.1 hypothetical protein AcV7_005801 [Antrodia cinnamomea]KAI0926741.1 hypothetical protein AcV5_007449 [Antrodia cinnamomea]KAI0953667.1 hypothetical protein AcW1_007829 [Antrodia cinnamomea]